MSDLKGAERTKAVMRELRMRSINVNAPGWFKNMGLNVRAAKKGASKAFDSRLEYATQSTVIIYASGASLSRYQDTIHKVNDVALNVATPTNLKWLIERGVRVDCVVVADASPAMAHKIDEAEYVGPVVLPTTADPGIKGELYWYKLVMGNGTIDDENYGLWNMAQHAMFEDVHDFLPSELSCVTNIALAYVVGLMTMRPKPGLLAKRVILAGADYAYWDDWARIDDPLRPKPLDVDKIDNWDGYSTNVRMLYYKWALYNYWRMLHHNAEDMVPIYSLSEGILNELPRIYLDDIIHERFEPMPDDLLENMVEFGKRFVKEFGDKVENADT